MNDAYVALTRFAKERFVAGGLPESRIVVKPNFVHPDPGPGEHESGNLLFVGRLSPEKGVRTLIQAWPRLNDAVSLKIVGTGPLEEEVCQWSRQHPNVECLGSRTPSQVYVLMKQARALVVTSTSYESFGRVVIEAFATGLPVIASRLGALAELVHDSCNGLHFQAGDPEDLAAKVEWLLANPKERAAMGRRAHEEFLAKYTGERGYEMLMDIYSLAAERMRAGA